MQRIQGDRLAKNSGFDEGGWFATDSVVAPAGRGFRRVGVVAELVSGGLAALGAWGVISIAGVPRALFCRGAAWLAGLLSGSPIVPVDSGWLLPAAVPAVVTEACSGTTFYVMVAALLGWHLAKRDFHVIVAGVLAVVAAVPLAVGINSVRIVTVMQAHRWVIPHFPESYSPFLHMLTGMAVFLPALIALNLLFETYGNSRLHHAAV